MPKLNIGVMFGGRTVEHEVSVITGLQAIENMDKEKYNVIPIYVSRDGNWYTGDELLNIKNYKDLDSLLGSAKKVFLPSVPSMGGLYFYPFKTGLFKKEPEFIKLDVIFPAFHGMHGEDGTMQGLFEIAGIPYAGSSVIGSAVGMDKIIMKDIFKANDIPIVEYTWFLRNDYQKDSRSVLDNIERKLKYPMFVKPANLGSSIGISRAVDRKTLVDAIEIAIRYDRKVIVEQGVSEPIEINCSCLGLDDDISVSLCEQPYSWQEFLSYDDKYMRGSSSKGMKSATRKIPAPIPDEKTEEIKRLTAKVFKVLDCSGVSRVDFLIDRDSMNVYVNEINTIPGSFAFYLWEPCGISFKQLIDRLIDIAIKRHKERNENMYTYDTELLHKASMGGAKGGKTGK